MPALRSLKEVKQFLGLAGYNRKVVLRISYIPRPLTSLTKKDVPFEWTHDAFILLKKVPC